MDTLTNTRNVFESIIRSDPALTAMLTVTNPAYRYFHHKGSKDQYFWTTECVRHNSKKRYASGVYHYLKNAKQWKLTNETYHAKRKDAKARALKLWEGEKKS